MQELLCVCVSETDISQRFDGGSPHLPWDHPFYDIARHQIIEVAGQSWSKTNGSIQMEEFESLRKRVCLQVTTTSAGR